MAFDNRGAGRSDKPDTPYSIQSMAEDACAVLKASGHPSADVVGISMGGRIALELAIVHPEVVNHLALVSTSARVSPGISRKLLYLLVEGPRRMGTWRSRYPQPAFAYRRQREASQSYDATKNLPAIRAPTLILHGRKDRFAPLDLAEEMHRGIVSSKMVTFDGGHLYPFFHPNEFAQAVDGFLAS